MLAKSDIHTLILANNLAIVLNGPSNGSTNGLTNGYLVQLLAFLESVAPAFTLDLTGCANLGVANSNVDGECVEVEAKLLAVFIDCRLGAMGVKILCHGTGIKHNTRVGLGMRQGGDMVEVRSTTSTAHPIYPTNLRPERISDQYPR